MGEFEAREARLNNILDFYGVKVNGRAGVRRYAIWSTGVAADPVDFSIRYGQGAPKDKVAKVLAELLAGPVDQSLLPHLTRFINGHPLTKVTKASFPSGSTFVRGLVRLQKAKAPTLLAWTQNALTKEVHRVTVSSWSQLQGMSKSEGWSEA